MIGAGVGDIFWIIMLNCSERIPGLYFWVLLLVVRKYQGSRTLQTVGHPVAPSMSGSSNSFSAFLGSSFLVRITWICRKNTLLGMNVDRWFAIKFPEAYQKSLKTHHTWFIVGAWWLLALIPDLPLWFVPNFFSYSFSPFSWFGPIFSFSFFLWFDQYVERGMKDHGCHCFVPIQNVSFFFISFQHIFLSSGSLDVVQDCHLFCDSQLNHYNDLGLPGAYSED